jgi:FkbM family methyltransferase
MRLNVTAGRRAKTQVARDAATTAAPAQVNGSGGLRMLLELREAIGPLLRAAKSLSFAQYGQDLLLAVTLLPARRGCYVDVGAYHPWRESNTYKLYLRGWSGVTIEPNPDVAPLFRRKRPRDVHVVSGVALEPGALRYHRFRDPKLNTFSEERARLCGSDSKAIDELVVPCAPLQQILDERGVGPIDLLSIDCEGFDLAALKSLDFARRRPTAILVEDYEAFEKFKTGKGLSAIEAFLRDKAYVPVGQAMYSTLWIDQTAVERRDNGAFRLPEVQFA